MNVSGAAAMQGSHPLTAQFMVIILLPVHYFQLGSDTQVLQKSQKHCYTCTSTTHTAMSGSLLQYLISGGPMVVLMKCTA